MAARLKRSAGFISVHRAYKFDRAEKKMFLDKTHFNLSEGVALAALSGGAGVGVKKALSLFRTRAQDLSRITCVGIRPGGRYFEIYFA